MNGTSYKFLGSSRGRGMADVPLGVVKLSPELLELAGGHFRELLRQIADVLRGASGVGVSVMRLGPTANPTLVHHGYAQGASFHVLSTHGAPFADLYFGNATTAKRVAQVIANHYGAPLVLAPNDEAGSRGYISAAESRRRSPLDQPGGPLEAVAPGARTNPAAPAAGQVWLGIVDGRRDKIVAVAGSRVLVLHAESGNREWMDAREFSATHKPVGTRRNPRTRARWIGTPEGSSDPLFQLNNGLVVMAHQSGAGGARHWLVRGQAERFLNSQVMAPGNFEVYKPAGSPMFYLRFRGSATNPAQRGNPQFYPCACGAFDVPQRGAWTAEGGYEGIHSVAKCWIPELTRQPGIAGYLVLAGAKPRTTRSEPAWARKPLGDLDELTKNPRQLSVPERHQLKIARDTLKMNETMARVMGGPSHAEAREIIYRLTGKRPTEHNPRGGPRVVFNRLLGGWYVVVGPHQTPLGGRFNSKADAQAWLAGGGRRSNPEHATLRWEKSPTGPEVWKAEGPEAVYYVAKVRNQARHVVGFAVTANTYAPDARGQFWTLLPNAMTMAKAKAIAKADADARRRGKGDVRENPGETRTAFFDRFALELPAEAVEDMSGPGPADAAVAHWAPRIARPSEITPAKLKAELKEFGAWDADELADDGENWQRILWIAAGNIREEGTQDNPARSRAAKRGRTAKRLAYKSRRIMRAADARARAIKAGGSGLSELSKFAFLHSYRKARAKRRKNPSRPILWREAPRTLADLARSRVHYEGGRFLESSIIRDLSKDERDAIESYLVRIGHPLASEPGTQVWRIAAAARELAATPGGEQSAGPGVYWSGRRPNPRRRNPRAPRIYYVESRGGAHFVISTTESGRGKRLVVGSHATHEQAAKQRDALTRGQAKPNPSGFWQDVDAELQSRGLDAVAGDEAEQLEREGWGRGKKNVPGNAAWAIMQHRGQGFGARSNPRPFSDELERARDTFHMWHEFDADRLERVQVPSRTIPRHLVNLGEVVRIDYKSNKWEGRPVTYTHSTKRPRPRLVTDPDARQLFIVGGKMRPTADGLIN